MAPIIEEILKSAGFQVLLSEEYEADDYAGSLVMKFREETSIILMTKDHDYLQLVNDEHNVRAWMVQTKQEKADDLYKKYYSFYGVNKKDINLPEKVFEYTAATVFREEGVRPEQIADLKGIQGDSSDNIPGVKGVSSAAPLLLREYGTVEEKSLKELQDFWKNELGISRSPYKAMTKESEEELCGEKAALLSKTLATMKTDISIDMSLEGFSSESYQEEKIREWLKKLDIKEASIFGSEK